MARNFGMHQQIRREYHHIGVDAASRYRRLTNTVAVIAGDHDRIAVRIDAGDDADMTAAATAHDGDGADLWSRNAMAVTRERTRHVRAGAVMTGALQNHVHEARAPQAAPTRGIAAEIVARFHHEARAAARCCRSSRGGVRREIGMRICKMPQPRHGKFTRHPSGAYHVAIAAARRVMPPDLGGMVTPDMCGVVPPDMMDGGARMNMAAYAVMGPCQSGRRRRGDGGHTQCQRNQQPAERREHNHTRSFVTTPIPPARSADIRGS